MSNLNDFLSQLLSKRPVVIINQNSTDEDMLTKLILRILKGFKKQDKKIDDVKNNLPKATPMG